MYTDTVTGKQFECTELHNDYQTCGDCANSREVLERRFKYATAYSYEMTLGDYSMGNINRAQFAVSEARTAVEEAGGVIDGNHNITWPEVKSDPEKHYAVFNTQTGSFVVSVAHGNMFLLNKTQAKHLAADFNAAMKPEHQSYTVVTVIFDKEV